MDLFQAMQISATGLSAQRIRMNVIATNLANASTTKTPEGGPFRRKDVFFTPVELDRTGGTHRNGLRPVRFEDELTRHLQGVEVTRVVQDTRKPRMVYNPSHPEADERGYVAMPNINVITEMVGMMNAQRSYEAGVAAINASKAMVNKALTIGR